jgi:hypothetical protein
MSANRCLIRCGQRGAVVMVVLLSGSLAAACSRNPTPDAPSNVLARPFVVTSQSPATTPVGNGLFVNSLSAWDRLSSSERKSAESALQVEEKRDQTSIRSFEHTEHDVTNLKFGGTTSGSDSPFDLSSSEPHVATLTSASTQNVAFQQNDQLPLQTNIPCVTILSVTLCSATIEGYGDGSPNLFTLGGTSYGLTFNAMVGKGPYGAAYQPDALVTTYEVPESPSSSEAFVAATLSTWSIDVTFSTALLGGGCDVAWINADGPSAETDAGSPNNITPCLSTFHADSLFEGGDTIASIISALEDGYGVVTADAGAASDPNVCNDLNAFLAYGTYIKDVSGSILPSLSCTPASFSWTSPGPVPTGSDLDFDVEPEAGIGVVGADLDAQLLITVTSLEIQTEPSTTSSSTSTTLPTPSTTVPVSTTGVPPTLFGPDNIMSDNFTTDSSLNQSLWSENSSLLLSMGPGISSPPDQYIPASLTFGSTGMTLSGVNGTYQYAGLQSTKELTAPFTVSASVSVAVADGNPFALILGTAPGNWAGLWGNVNSQNGNYYGINLSSSASSAVDHVYTAPQTDTWYVLKIEVSSSGLTTFTVLSSSGQVLGSASGPNLGSNPLSLLLMQIEGLPNTTGPNVATWGAIRVGS